MERDGDWDAVQAFYDLHPYPPPVDNLDEYRRRWQEAGRRRADFHLHWPEKPFQDEDLTVLVAGCGTSQAAKHALRNPLARVVGIDISSTSIRHTQELQQKYKLENLEVYQLPVERAGELGTCFDKVICTGVLHHLRDPEEGLRALRDALAPEGALHLMVYATYGRVGVYLLRDYARLLGIGNSNEEISDFANTLLALPQDHPLAGLLGESPDFRSKAGLADALLNPQDRAYSVPQLFTWIERCGLKFGRWLRQAPYLPQCGKIATTPHAARLKQLPIMEQFAAVELFRGTMLRHNLIAYRDDYTNNCQPVDFNGNQWPSYVPIGLPEVTRVEERLPAGAVAVLINQHHTYPDLYLPIREEEKWMYAAIDGQRSIDEIRQQVTTSLEKAGNFFERLWQYDQVLFNLSKAKEGYHI